MFLTDLEQKLGIEFTAYYQILTLFFPPKPYLSEAC